MSNKNQSSLFEAICQLTRNHNEAMGYTPKAIKEDKPDLLMDMGISETSIMEDLEFLKNPNAIPRKVDDLYTDEDHEPNWLGKIRELGDADPANILIASLENIKNTEIHCFDPVKIISMANDAINDYWDAMGLNTGLKYQDGKPVKVGDRIEL